MGKSTIDLPIQNIGQSVSQAQNPLSAVTPESTSATRREKKVSLGSSDPPTRSFLRRRLDEQSQMVKQTFSRGIDKLHDVIRSTSETQTRLLEVLVSKVGDDKSFDFS
ncbi:hypothetical protein ACFX12_030642 [Malus domestica]